MGDLVQKRFFVMLVESLFTSQKHPIMSLGLKVRVRNSRKLKNKYDLTLCQSRLHTASETFVRHNFLDQVRFSAFFASVASILIGKEDEKKKNAYEDFGLSVQGP